MAFSEFEAISEELRVGIQRSTASGDQGWKTFGNQFDKL